jgi:hypothetical protein
VSNVSLDRYRHVLSNPLLYRYSDQRKSSLIGSRKDDDMEAMHLTTHLSIQQAMADSVAFSARPGAPILPLRDERRAPIGVLRSALRPGRRPADRRRLATAAC